MSLWKSPKGPIQQVYCHRRLLGQPVLETPAIVVTRVDGVPANFWSDHRQNSIQISLTADVYKMIKQKGYGVDVVAYFDRRTGNRLNERTEIRPSEGLDWAYKSTRYDRANREHYQETSYYAI